MLFWHALLNTHLLLRHILTGLRCTADALHLVAVTNIGNYVFPFSKWFSL